MLGIIRVREEICCSFLLAEFLQCCFIIDEGHHDLPIFGNVGLTNEDEIIMIDSLLIHGISLSPEEEVRICLIHNLGGYGYLGLDILFSEYRHPTCYRTDERNRANLITSCGEVW